MRSSKEGFQSIPDSNGEMMVMRPSPSSAVNLPDRAAHYERSAAKVDASNYLRQYDLPRIRERGAFLVREVAFNTIYACDLRALADLCSAVNLPDRAAHYARSAERAGAAILRLMYDEETAAFYDISGATNASLKVLTAMSLFPLLLPEMPKDKAGEIVRRHLSNPDEFASPYPIPSVAMSERSFYAKETFA